MNTQPVNITSELRKRDIKVDCRISRYVGVNTFLKSFDFARRKVFSTKKITRISNLLPLNGAKQLIKGNKAFGVNADLDPNGGLTQVALIDIKTNAVMGYGEAICSDQDTFNRSRGYQIALNRAIKNAKISVG